MYDRAFFALQWRFAERTGWPRERALLEATNFYVRLGFGHEFDADHPGWRAYLDGLVSADDPIDWTMACYHRNAESGTRAPTVATVGCFSYGRLPSGEVRVHFRNVAPRDRSPFDAANRAERATEMRELIRRMADDVSPSTPVIGTSWLYNLEGYRCLFPPAYLATARDLRGKFRSMTLWGQFLDRHGGVRAGPRDRFLAALADPALDEDDCFPLKPWRLEAPAAVFFEHTGI
ncbi:MAG: hypothetical protein AAGD14_11020 [Planctomycetota bacterium]